MMSTEIIRQAPTNVRSYFGDWTTWEKAWLTTFTALVLGLSIVWNDTPLGIFVSLSGIWCVVLVAKGKIANYYIGIPNVIGYAYLSFNWQYYGEVMLNLLFFLPMQFVGIYYWRRNQNNKTRADEVRVEFLSGFQRILMIAGTVLLVYIYGTFLKSIGGSLPYFDASSTVLSIIAMFLMVYRYMEQWVLWIVVNIVSIYLWAFVLIGGGVEVTILLMWTAYLVNAIYGWWNWIVMYREQRAN